MFGYEHVSNPGKVVRCQRCIRYFLVLSSCRIPLSCYTGIGDIGIGNRPLGSDLPMMITLFGLAILRRYIIVSYTSLIQLSVVQKCHSCNQRRPANDPPSIFAKVASSWWLSDLRLHSELVWVHSPWVQQYLHGLGQFLLLVHLFFFCLHSMILLLQIALFCKLLAVFKSVITSWIWVIIRFSHAWTSAACFCTLFAITNSAAGLFVVALE